MRGILEVACQEDEPNVIGAAVLSSGRPRCNVSYLIRVRWLRCSSACIIHLPSQRLGWPTGC